MVPAFAIDYTLERESPSLSAASATPSQVVFVLVVVILPTHDGPG
jgi:hypothetical protein